ncbi:GAF and ANTAR domain-containing protein [Pseudonocardia humida]|uniref:GAF and ANTAR domain-containing protein n=1 Tax=Pseudonocardia humida TaxID=2800819 RepID=A0ABT1A8K7_9PSEU|nr:ANTAR domain-containing protein [Pseudonocardia humida]MCO1659159.1 GAF and ANTAR domain-containing protein [Pseudonocardia humida]
MASEQEWGEDRVRFAVVPPIGSVDDLATVVGPLAEQFVRLAENLAGATSVQGVLSRVCEAALVTVPGADLVSVTLRADDGFHTPARTDELAHRLDQVQYRLDEGPCVEATRTPGMGVTFSADLGAGREYPRFGPEAAALGVCSVLAVGLFPGGASPRYGALNIYSREVGGLDELDRDLALVLAAHASTALSATMAHSTADLELAQLRQAISSRDVIGQAKGILMERRGVSADEAFDILRQASQSLNVKLSQVAQTLVDRRAEI